MAIPIKSYNQILGEIARKVIADTPIDDINDGSAIFTLLEAIAGGDFDNNVAAISLLELLNVDNLRNAKLDDRAESIGLKRKKAQKSTGYIKVGDSAITKRSTGLYPVKPAPYVGATKLYVLDASGWASTGQIYIGRGTSSFEGPISYSSITNNTTYYTINLSSALQKNHLISEVVIDAQGTTNRLIAAGTTIQIPANSSSPTIEYVTLRDAVIPAGDAEVTNVEAVAVLAGEASNANIGTISTFGSLPFSTATVTNTSAFTGGSDIESDEDLKTRIKSYAASLARGTDAAILNVLLGMFDASENKQIKSANVVEPASKSKPSTIYLDDGTAFEPSYSGQPVDPLITDAVGDETYLQLSNWPLPRPQLVSSAIEPIALADGMTLRVLVDSSEETITFNSADFTDITAARLIEVISVINDQATLFKARLTNSSQNILIYTASDAAETIQVSEIGENEDENFYANSALKFPTKEASYIKLYINGELLRETESKASVTTNVFETWAISTTQTLTLKVDQAPVQVVSFSTADFDNVDFSELTAQDWADLIPTKIAGVSAEVLSTNQLRIYSNKDGGDSQVTILGGTIVTPWFDGELVSSVGRDSDFVLNRHTGNIELLRDLEAGDVVTAGAEDVKGHVLSDEFTGTVDIGLDTFNRPANLVVVADAQDFKYRNVALALNSTITVSRIDATTVRLMASSLNTFKSIVPGPQEYIYITSHGDTDNTGDWLRDNVTGLMVIKAKGNHTTAGTDSYIELQSYTDVADPIAGTYTVSQEDDIKAFYSDAYPQVWSASSLSSPTTATIDDIVESMSEQLSGVKISKVSNKVIKISSTTEEDGSIALPVVTGNALALFAPTTTALTGYDSHVANVVESKDGVSWFKPGTVYDADSAYPIWLDRTAYADVAGNLTAVSEVLTAGSYEKQLEATTVLADANVDVDSVVFTTGGPNKGHIANVAQLLSGDKVGTQYSKLAAYLEDTASSTSSISLAKPLQFSGTERLVVKVDGDEDKNISTPMYRTGKVNSGSQSLVFSPTTTAFSADDVDGETGTDFGSSIWGDTLYPTNFKDYKILFRARNWYRSLGYGSGTPAGSFLIRSSKYGPVGENLRFALEYPLTPDQDATVDIDDSDASASKIAYIFESGAAIPVGVSSNAELEITYTGADDIYTYKFSSGDFSGVSAGDIVSLLPDCGADDENSGQFKILSVSPGDKEIEVYNPNATETTPEIPGSFTVTTLGAGSLNGTYFLLAIDGVTYAIWYDVDDVGTPEPAHGATYGIEIDGVITGDTAAAVAAQTLSVLLAYTQGGNPVFTGSVLSNTITLAPADGIATGGTAGTSGFTVGYSAGTAGEFNIISNPASLHFFPFTAPTVADFVTTVNDAQERIKVVGQGTTSLTLDLATKEEIAPAGTLSYGHDPAGDTPGVVALYDSQNWILSHQTGNANFSLKKAMVLLGTPAYSINLCPNHDSNSVGEFFKLVPSTVENINHHLNHPAISQMSIVTDIDVAEQHRRTQLKSKQIGSSGALEVATGTANNMSLEVVGTSAVVASDFGNVLELRVPSTDALNVGDFVKLTNNAGVARSSRWLDGLTTVDVVRVSDGVYRYVFNPKLEVRDYDSVVTVDDSSTYGRASNKVFKTTVTAYAGYPLTQITGDATGVATAPGAYDASSSVTSTIAVLDKYRGAVSGNQVFRIDVPTPATSIQSYFVRFYDPSGNQWAVWFAVDGNTTAPTGGVWTGIASARRVRVDLLSSDTKLQIQNKLTEAINNVADVTSNIAASFTATTVSTEVFNPDLIVEGDHLVLAPGPQTATATMSKYVFGFTGSGIRAGFPIMYKNPAEPTTFHILNPLGSAVSTRAENLGLLSVIASPYTKFHVAHVAPTEIDSVTISSNVATVVTTQPHGLSVGGQFTMYGNTIIYNTNYGTPYTGTVTSVTDHDTFTFSYTASDASSTGGGVLPIGTTATHYRVEKVGHNDLFRIKHTGTGTSPLFLDHGVALDDYVVISGTTFNPANNGTFRVRGVTNDSLIVQNANGVEELNADALWFNDFNSTVSWTNGSTTVSGTAGSFKNLAVGSLVKKASDPDSYFRAVASLNAAAATATSITLSDTYSGITGTEEGVYYVPGSAGFNQGRVLKNVDDIVIYEGDSALVGDSLYIANQSDEGWFNPANSGVFAITEIGITSDYRPYLQVNNDEGVEQTDVDLSINVNGFVVQEGSANKLDTVRVVKNIIPDSDDETLAKIYLFPSDHSDKFNETNATVVTPLGKLSLPSLPTTGLDGYLYYTGLLQKAQRTINGYDPDLDTYPGRKALGASIELLPPLAKRVTLSINVSTNNGVIVSDVSSEVKSVIINYVLGLGVGENVILSEIIARVMKIRGVAAVTFTDPEPSEERIVISSNEKAFIEAKDINVG